MIFSSLSRRHATHPAPFFLGLPGRYTRARTALRNRGTPYMMHAIPFSGVSRIPMFGE